MLATLLLACASSPSPEDSTARPAAADASGPYVPATFEDTATNSLGQELDLQVWYPASEPDDDAHEYDDFYEGQARDGGTPACAAARPVAVFSHGNTGMRWQSLFLTEHLASHGWIVAAPDHEGNTFFDPNQTARSELLLRRPDDVRAAFDRVLALADTGGPLEGCVDSDAGYAVMGHSFGGYTSFAIAGADIDGAASAAYCADHAEAWLCPDVAAAVGNTRVDLSDPRVWAAVPMAPAGYEALLGGLTDIAVPTLVFAGGRDDLTPLEGTVRPLYDGLDVSDRALATLPDAGHFTFSDACALLGDSVYDDCAPPYLDAADAHPRIAAMTLAFLDRAAGGDQWPEWLPPVDDPVVVWEAP
jgi:predicted dienelactone hydrolase